jgi:alpha-galactosidase
MMRSIRHFKFLATAAFAGMVILIAASADSPAESPKKDGWVGGPKVAPDEMADKNNWVKQYLDAEAAAPPFSFVFDGKPSGELLKTWTKKVESKKLDDVRTQIDSTWTDPNTGLEVRCTAVDYSDFPTVEWTVYLKNSGKQDTPLVSNFRGIDARIESQNKRFYLHYNIGTTVEDKDFQPLVEEIVQGKVVSLTPRQTGSGGIWPYFNLQYDVGGRMIVVGWPGRWLVSFDRDDDKSLHVTAGQELVNAKLLPGEEIRSPLMVQQFYRGDITRAQNLWRRWMKAHNMPKPGGKLPPPQMTPCSSHQYAEMTQADEASQIMFVDRYVEEGIKIDYWWMDAGWYPCDGQWPLTGTWEVDKTRFPNGLRAISDHARKKGIKTIVWFEPERLVPNSWLYKNHKEWVIGDSLLNLGNPEALKWAIEHFSKMIAEEGIDLYRQDYNIGPLPIWRANDAPDRQGITENKYVVGYLAYWDGLVKNKPDLLIDSCSGGGHRNDLETMRRAVPLLRSDYIFFPVGQQSHTYGLAQWLPYFGTGTKTLTAYDFRSCMCPGMIPCWDMRDKNLDYDLMRKLAKEWRSVAQNYLGDYYPLTPYSLEKNVWMAWQFDSPESGEGLVQAFRRDDCENAKNTFRLQGLDPGAIYEIVDLDVGTPVKISGKNLMEEGLAVEIKAKPGAAVITYRLVK